MALVHEFVPYKKKYYANTVEVLRANKGIFLDGSCAQIGSKTTNQTLPRALSPCHRVCYHGNGRMESRHCYLFTLVTYSSLVYTKTLQPLRFHHY
jgi:hypothetical protein